MHINDIQGRIDRIFFNTVERLLYLKLEHDAQIHTLRVGDNSAFRGSVMLSKPGDDVIIQTHGERISKWENRSLDFTGQLPKT